MFTNIKLATPFLNPDFRRLQENFYLNFRKNQPNTTKSGLEFKEILGERWVTKIQKHQNVKEKQHCPIPIYCTI